MTGRLIEAWKPARVSASLAVMCAVICKLARPQPCITITPSASPPRKREATSGPPRARGTAEAEALPQPLLRTDYRNISHTVVLTPVAPRRVCGGTDPRALLLQDRAGVGRAWECALLTSSQAGPAHTLRSAAPEPSAFLKCREGTEQDRAAAFPVAAKSFKNCFYMKDFTLLINPGEFQPAVRPTLRGGHRRRGSLQVVNRSPSTGLPLRETSLMPTCVPRFPNQPLKGAQLVKFTGTKMKCTRLEQSHRGEDSSLRVALDFTTLTGCGAELRAASGKRSPPEPCWPL